MKRSTRIGLSLQNLEEKIGNLKTMATVKLRKGSSIEAAIQRLRRQVDREGTLKTARAKRFYEKPSRKKYRKMRRAKFNQRARSIENDNW